MATSEHRPERTCAGCRKKDSPKELVRVLLDDGGALVPDVAGGGFGRGAWLHPRPDCLLKAAPGGLSRSFRAPVKTSAGELARLLKTAAERRSQGLLVAARRAGKLAVGSSAVEEVLTTGSAWLVIVARDARAAAASTAVERAIAEGRAVAWSTKHELGKMLGRDEVGVAALLDEGLASALRSSLTMASLAEPHGATAVPATEVS
jgi:predicted RNA-binding protein YlxR (DUF448 family)/ribosomal protein L30E